MKFTIAIGLYKGYTDHDNSGLPRKKILIEVAKEYKKLADEVEEELGIYISSLLIPAAALYKEEWGCPTAGETIIVFTGNRNPEFQKKKLFKKAVLLIAAKLQKKLKQTTVTVEFQQSEFIYLVQPDSE